MRIEWGRLGAEFIVIVVGVMAALAADRWQQSRSNADTAHRYLERLISDIELDLADYEVVVASSDAIDRSIQYVLDVFRAEDDVQPENYQRFVTAVLASSFAPSPRGTDATYTDLVSSGTLGLLPTPLRESVIGYYEEKSELIDGRMETFRTGHRDGYWQFPSLILGPEILPELWVARGGATDDYIPQSKDIALSPDYIAAATQRLRSIPSLEQKAAQVRYYMTQRKFIYGERLSEAANELMDDLEYELRN